MKPCAGLSEEDRRKRTVENALAHETALNQLLATPQLARFKQLGIQRQGLLAFKEPEIVAALDLTSEQRRKIRDIEHEAFDRHGPPISGPGRPPRGPPPSGDRINFNRQDLLDRTLAVLSTEQLQQWRRIDRTAI